MEKIKLRGVVVDYNKRHNLLKLSLKSVQIDNEKAEDVSQPLILHCFWDDSLLDNKAPAEVSIGDTMAVTVNVNGRFFFISALERVPIFKQAEIIGLVEYMDELIYQSGKTKT